MLFQRRDNVVCAANWRNWNAENALVRCNSVLDWRAPASVRNVWKRCIRMINARIICHVN